MRLFSNVLLIAGALALSACTLGGKSVPLTVVEPQLDPIDVTGLAAVDWSLEVPRPLADQTRDSDRVIVRRDGGRLQVYPGVSWLDSLPDMVQTLTVQALSDSGRFAAVGRDGLRAPNALAMEIRRFELVDADGERAVKLVIAANLFDPRERTRVATRTFQARQPVASSDLDATVTAFEAALSGLMSDLLVWILEAGGEQG